jgi:hypothetical protein
MKTTLSKILTVVLLVITSFAYAQSAEAEPLVWEHYGITYIAFETSPGTCTVHEFDSENGDHTNTTEGVPC